MTDPDPDDTTEPCASCDGPVERDEAFVDDGRFFHPACAEVWKCPNCAKWNEKTSSSCECGETKPE